MAVGGRIGSLFVNLGSDEVFEFECNLCRDGTTVKEGIAYCDDCDEFLCKICLTSHKRIRLTANHNILQGSTFPPVKQHGGPPQSAGEFCEVHKQELVTDICMTHKQIICGKCKTSKHRKCVDVKLISDVCGTQAASRFLGELKVLLKELKVLKQRRGNDLDKLTHGNQTALKDIDDLRKQLNQLLDRLEKNIMKDLQETVEKHTSSIKHQLSRLNSAIKSLETDLDKFNKVQQSGSISNIFTAMERSDKLQLHQLQKDIEQNSKDVEIQFQPDTKLQDLLKNLQCLGQICDSPETQNCLSADLRDSGISKVEEYNVKEDNNTAIPSIIGAVFLDDGRLIICDCNNRKVKLLSADFKLVSSLTLNSEPCGIVIISDSVVAVTLPYGRQLQYVTVSAQGLDTDRIQMIDRTCCGITRYKDRLYTACTDPVQVLVLDLEGQVLHMWGDQGLFGFPFYIRLPYFGPPLYITVGKDGLLYISEPLSNTINCLSQEGKTVYRHEVKSLKNAQHLLMDDDKYVYICDSKSNNIQIITPSGKLYKELINKEDGQNGPYCMAYRQFDRTLVVGVYECDTIMAVRFV